MKNSFCANMPKQQLIIASCYYKGYLHIGLFASRSGNPGNVE
ncbi:MAG: hypothetical protein PVJ01_04380 [Pseudomonadota bacterium]